jgi:hypothetical protein
MEPENEQSRTLPSACMDSRCHAELGKESTDLRGCHAIVFLKTFQQKGACIAATGASYGFFPSAPLRTGYAECALRMTLRALHLSG